MKTFCQYEFIDSLQQELMREIVDNQIVNEYDLNKRINQEISTACIYTNDCFDICKELRLADFKAYDRTINCIEDAAYLALEMLIYEDSEMMSELRNALSLKQE
jgi:hypothetical protein